MSFEGEPAEAAACSSRRSAVEEAVAVMVLAYGGFGLLYSINCYKRASIVLSD